MVLHVKIDNKMLKMEASHSVVNGATLALTVCLDG